MMRATPIEELEGQRLIGIQRRGALLDEEYQRLLEENEIEQQRLNRRSAECDEKKDKADLLNASFDQIIFGNQMRKRYGSIDRREEIYALKQRTISEKTKADYFIFFRKDNSKKHHNQTHHSQ